MMQSASAKMTLFIIAPLLALAAMVAVIPHVQAQVACTMEAMQCPDGSYVGRTGPNCNFAACPTPAPTPAPCTALSRDIFYGTTDASTGGQVTQLQVFLAAQGYLSSTSVIGRFGPLTLRAVQAFQRDNGVSTTGYVGVQTRAHIQAKCSPNPQPISSVRIYSVNPTSGPTGTTVSITGFGFTSDNTVHFGGGVIQHVPITSSIAIACTTSPLCHGGINQTIQFTVPSSLNPACYYSNPRCLIASQMTAPGTYNVYVENSNGNSAPVTFTVTSTQGQGSPSISSISPTSGAVGTSVTLGGNGFTSDNIIHFGGGAIAHVAATPAIFNCPMMPAGSTGGCGAYSQTLTFTVPSSVGPYCAPGMACPMYMQLITPGTYAVYVENAGGTSNNVTFTVTGSGTNQSISINGIDAPSSLALGQQGTWTVHASVGTNAQFHYSVVWGDETNMGTSIMAPASQQIQTSATFTHAYQNSGTYTATFTVSDDSGHSATASATVLVTPLY
jgi:hypothetical protein